MGALVRGRLDWDVTRDVEGHRDYKIKWLVETDDYNDGPTAVGGAAGLPLIGSSWQYGNDTDLAARCHPDLTATPVVKNEKNRHWYVDQKFSTRPINVSNEQEKDNPLLEPAKVGGSFIRYTQEATADRDGKPLINSCLEMYRGAVAERDGNRPTVQITQNVPIINAIAISQAIDNINSNTMWGLPPGTIKLSDWSWSRSQISAGLYYYTNNFGFDISFTGWTRIVIDEGTRYLKPNGNPYNPLHYVINKDERGENGTVLLDGAGGKLTNVNNAFYHSFNMYPATNLLSLGVPATL